MQLVKILSILTLCTLFSACSWFGDTDEPDLPEHQLYDQAMQALDSSDFDEAVKNLEKLEARYPFGRFSEQAQLELVYAYHKNYEPEAASAAAERFIRLHPSHDNIDYVYYIKGLTAFEQDRTMIERFLPIDINQRDPGAALSSFESFSILLNRYPDSKYAPDARKRMVFLKNRLAAYEMHVARYYMKRGAYIAAANRGRYIVENLKETPSIPNALAIMYQAYDQLKMKDLAEDTKAVLLANYPDYNLQSYRAENKTLMETATFGLVGSEDDAAEYQRPGESAELIEDRPWYHKATFGVFE